MYDAPGPKSKAWLQRLKAVESPNVTFVRDAFPVVWASAQGAVVTDVDGREYLDAGSSFGVALIGHAHPMVVDAACRQTRKLLHGMGDVHPPVVRIQLLEQLAAIAPGDLGFGVLCTGGSEAVEVALKTAVLATGRAGTLSFFGGYHGLSTGALAVTARAQFRDPFAANLPQNGHFSTFPRTDAEVGPCLQGVEDLLRQPQNDIGVVMVEPIQGRGGSVVPGAGWLAGLAGLCKRYGALLCCDEIFTGLCRTGDWFAVDHDAVVPDLLCVGKALGGGFPVSACLGRPEVMAAWGESTGEALHTSTFLGHPVACAAALATLKVLHDDSIHARAREAGDLLVARLRNGWPSLAQAGVTEIRGRGLLLGIVAAGRPQNDASDIVLKTVVGCLRRGVIALPCGDDGSVLQLTPPAICSDEQLRQIADTVVDAWNEAAS